MSSALALAATSRVIAAIIDDAVAAARLVLPSILGSSTTSSSPPDHLETSTETERTNLNLFLYHVTYNQGWREVGLPTQDSDGHTTERAPLGLDLHYLLSAYSASDYEAQMMLGIGMQALHEMPTLFREKINAVFKAPFATEVDKALATSGLVDQIELMKISPQQLSTDELAKLWTAIPGKFRISAGYAVSVALVETTAPSLAALPVLKPVVTIVPLVEPTIDAVVPQLVPFAPGASLTIHGGNLVGANTAVLFDGAPASLQTPTAIGNGAAVRVPLPLLSAGLNTLRVVRRVDLGETPMPTIVESNTASFALQPVIGRSTTPPFPYKISIGFPDPSTAPPTRPVTVTVMPELGDGQTILLLLTEANVPSGKTQHSYAFDAAARDRIAPDTIVFHTRGVATGKTYLVRVRVDGANSPLDIDSATKQFVAPAVTF